MQTRHTQDERSCNIIFPSLISFRYEIKICLIKCWKCQKIFQVDAQVYILKKEEGGRSKSFASFALMSIFSKTWDCSAQVLVPEGSIVMPGTHAK